VLRFFLVANSEEGKQKKEEKTGWRARRERRRQVTWVHRKCFRYGQPTDDGVTVNRHSINTSRHGPTS
jgi:hypothetical protein